MDSTPCRAAERPGQLVCRTRAPFNCGGARASCRPSQQAPLRCLQPRRRRGDLEARDAHVADKARLTLDVAMVHMFHGACSQRGCAPCRRGTAFGRGAQQQHTHTTSGGGATPGNRNTLSSPSACSAGRPRCAMGRMIASLCFFCVCPFLLFRSCLRFVECLLCFRVSLLCLGMSICDRGQGLSAVPRCTGGFPFALADLYKSPLYTRFALRVIQWPEQRLRPRCATGARPRPRCCAQT